MKIRSTIHYLLFALLLLFSQQLVVTHAISHLGAPAQGTAPDHTLPADGPCDECLASAALGTALGSSFQAHFATPFAHAGIAADFVEALLPAEYRPFNSRAPPSFTKTI